LAGGLFDWTDVLAIGHEIIFGRRAAVGQFFNVFSLFEPRTPERKLEICLMQRNYILFEEPKRNLKRAGFFFVFFFFEKRRQTVGREGLHKKQGAFNSSFFFLQHFQHFVCCNSE
jgi:hypothetical protein